MLINYRHATEADLPELLPLLKSLFALEVDFTFSASLQIRGLQLLLESTGATIILGLYQEKVVGMITGQLTISTAEGGPSLLIEDLVVAEEFHGCGVGSNLLAEIGQWGNSHNANRMQLLADYTNQPALDFYKHNGWQRTNLIGLRKHVNSTEEQ